MLKSRLVHVDRTRCPTEVAVEIRDRRVDNVVCTFGDGERAAAAAAALGSREGDRGQGR